MLLWVNTFEAKKEMNNEENFFSHATSHFVQIANGFHWTSWISIVQIGTHNLTVAHKIRHSICRQLLKSTVLEHLWPPLISYRTKMRTCRQVRLTNFSISIKWTINVCFGEMWIWLNRSVLVVHDNFTNHRDYWLE